MSLVGVRVLWKDVPINARGVPIHVKDAPVSDMGVPINVKDAPVSDMGIGLLPMVVGIEVGRHEVFTSRRGNTRRKRRQASLPLSGMQQADLETRLPGIRARSGRTR